MQKKNPFGRVGVVPMTFFLMLIIGMLLWANRSLAQSATTEPAILAEAVSISLWSTVTAGGPIGYLIMFMSLVAVSFIIEHFINIRRDRLIPTQLIYDLDQLLQAQQYEQARQLCAENRSYLASVVGAGLTQIGSMFGFFDMQNTMQRKIRRTHKCGHPAKRPRIIHPGTGQWCKHRKRQCPLSRLRRSVR